MADQIISTAQITLLDFTDFTFTVTPDIIFVPATLGGDVTSIPDIDITLSLEDSSGQDLNFTYKINNDTSQTFTGVKPVIKFSQLENEFQGDSGNITFTAQYKGYSIDTTLYWSKVKSGFANFTKYPPNVLKFMNYENNNWFYEYSPAILTYDYNFQGGQFCAYVLIQDSDGNNYYHFSSTNAALQIDLTHNYNNTSSQITQITAFLVTDIFKTQNDDGVITQTIQRNTKLTRDEIEDSVYNSLMSSIKVDVVSTNVFFGTSQDMAKFSIGATNIMGSIGDSRVNFSQQGLAIINGYLTVKNQQNTIFKVDNDNGRMYLRGQIEALAGTIGGWKINNSGIQSKNDKVGLYSDDSIIYNNQTIAFWAGLTNTSGNPYNFYITDDGKMYCRNAEVNGTINASSGFISGRLLVGSEQNGILIDGRDNAFISSSKFASGINGYGWRLDQDGTANFTNANISGTITSSVFEYNTTSSVGGNLHVAPTFTTSKIAHSTIISMLEQGNNQLFKIIGQVGDTDTHTSNLKMTKQAEGQYKISIVKAAYPRYYLGYNTAEGNVSNMIPGQFNGLIPGKSYNFTCTLDMNWTRKTSTATQMRYQITRSHINEDGISSTKAFYSSYVNLPETEGIITNIPVNITIDVPKTAKACRLTFRCTSTTNWAVGNYLTIHNPVLKPVDEDSSETADRLVTFNYQDNYNNIIENGKVLTISGNLLRENNTVNRNYTGVVVSNDLNEKTVTIKYRGEGVDWLQDTAIIDPSIGLLLSATDNYGPFMDVYNKINSSMPLVRLGNLTGLTDTRYFENISGYGLYSSNAYLSGQLMLPNAGITNQRQKSIETENGEQSPVRIWAGKPTQDSSIDQANFIVTEDGTMIARRGIFNGTVNATDSTFSGVIKAAGIIIDSDATEEVQANYNHFFVGYTPTPVEPSDYVLDIGNNGLTLWRGGFKAYSGIQQENNIYSYETTKQPLPFLYLKDDTIDSIFSARLISNQGHFIQIYKEDTNFKSSSVLINKGIWFGSFIKKTSYEGLEEQAYANILRNKTGIYYEDGLKLIGQKFQIQTNLNEFNGNTVVTGQLSVQRNGKSENHVLLGECTIKQHYDGDNSIGFDFIV